MGKLSRLKKGYSFDDVSLVPKRSSLMTRKDVDLTTYVSKNVKLTIPLVASPMIDVVCSKLGIALARQGGVAIMHRYCRIEDEANEILKVKRADAPVIENPYTLKTQDKIHDAISIMEKYGISGIPVVDDAGYLKGIVTGKDVWSERNHNEKIEKIMTGLEKLVYEQDGIDIQKAENLLREKRIGKLPLIDGQGYLKGIITSGALKKRQKYPFAARDIRGRLLVGAAVGATGDYLERTVALIEAGADFIDIDVAHGHSELCIKAVESIKNRYSIDVIAGAIATPEAARDLINIGADGLRVGVGPGSMCKTRVVTGAGVPQLTAIERCYEVAKKEGVPIIGDGGIRYSGDIVKAMAVGASSVIIGWLFAGTEESPGMVVEKDGKMVKSYKGMASAEANWERRKAEQEGFSYEELNEYTPEGVESAVPYKGPITPLIKKLVGGIKSGFSYCGARNFKDLVKNAELMTQTQSGLIEGKPRIE